MPIFEYQCDTCNSIFDFIEITKKESHQGYACKLCEIGTLNKIISTPGIVDRANLRIPLASSKQRRKIL